MELTNSSGAIFKGAILNKILSSEQESQVVSRTNEFKIPVIGKIGFHDEFQTDCLEGKALNASIESKEVDKIIVSILDRTSTP
jgi:MinD superfamily P-loop ATPase